MRIGKGSALIEYVLLFSLGFLSAAFLAFLVAPAIQGRVVRFTEKRIKATMPLSIQELKAQKDMARAAYAAENAKLLQDARQERERSASAQAHSEQLQVTLNQLLEERAETRMAFDQLEAEMRDLKSQMRGEDMEFIVLREKFAAAKAAQVADAAHIDELTKEVHYLTELLDESKLDIAARNTEIESLHSTINSIIGERQKLRDDMRVADEKARGSEMRLTRELNKIIRLEDKLERATANSASRENAIERRIAEIDRLKERLKAVSAKARAAEKALNAAGVDFAISDLSSDGDTFSEPEFLAEPETVSEAAAMQQVEPESEYAEEPADHIAYEDEGKPEAGEPVSIDAERLSATLRTDEVVLSDLLSSSPNPRDDHRLREEIAQMAARMVALTAQREGKASPLHKILSGDAIESKHDRLSLAERAARAMEGEGL